MNRIRDIRAELDALEQQQAELLAELRLLLAAEGRRPGDGSDQPKLFEPAPELTLFEEVQ